MSTLDHQFDDQATYEPDGPSQAQLRFHSRLVADIHKAINNASEIELENPGGPLGTKMRPFIYKHMEPPATKAMASLTIQELKCIDYTLRGVEIAKKLGIPAPPTLDPAIPLSQRVFDTQLAFDELQLVSLSHAFRTQLPPFTATPTPGQRRAHVDANMPPLQLRKLQKETDDFSLELNPGPPEQTADEIEADNQALESAPSPEARAEIFAEFQARDAAAALAAAPTLEAINSEISRLGQLPTRQQVRAIRDFAAESGETVELPTTRAEARKTMDFVKSRYAQLSEINAAGAGHSGDFATAIPDDSAELARPISYAPAIHDDELARVQEPYANAFDDRPQTSAREDLAREVNAIELPFEGPLAELQRTGSLNVISSQANAIASAARAAGVNDLTYDDAGIVQFESAEQAIATISAIHRSRASARSQAAPAPTHGGQWVDSGEHETRGPSEPQVKKLQDLADQLNLEIVEPSGSSYSTKPIEQTGYNGRIVVPETSSDTSRLISELIERTDAQESYIEVAGQVRGLDRSELASLRATMTDRESQILDLRFSEGQSRETVCKVTNLSPEHLQASENLITVKAKKHLEARAKNLQAADRIAQKNQGSAKGISAQVQI